MSNIFCLGLGIAQHYCVPTYTAANTHTNLFVRNIFGNVVLVSRYGCNNIGYADAATNE